MLNQFQTITERSHCYAKWIDYRHGFYLLRNLQILDRLYGISFSRNDDD